MEVRSYNKRLFIVEFRGYGSVKERFVLADNLAQVATAFEHGATRVDKYGDEEAMSLYSVSRVDQSFIDVVGDMVERSNGYVMSGITKRPHGGVEPHGIDLRSTDAKFTGRESTSGDFFEESQTGQMSLGLKSLNQAKTLLQTQQLLTELKQALTNSEVNHSETFAVFKQSDGRYRWIARSSNAFRDRDGEIVSTKALAEDVARADADGDYGPLRFWHMPGVDIGDCDFNWLRGRTLVESGTFRDEQIGQRTAEKADSFQISLGFKHPPDNPDAEGVYHRIKRIERSLVPAGRAANPFTSLTVKEQSMNDSEKLLALKALLNDEAKLKAILAGADSSEKTADNMGLAFKEFKGDLNGLNVDQLLEVAIARKEAVLQKPAEKADDDKKEDAPRKGDDEDDDEDMPPFMKKMSGYVSKMGGYMDRMDKMFAQREKEAGTVTAVQDASINQSERIAGLETTIKGLTSQLNEALTSLKELQGDIPTGVLTGKRPSQAEDNVTGQVEKDSPNGETHLDKFLDGFIFAGQQ